jgi:hypothetical protein
MTCDVRRSSSSPNWELLLFRGHVHCGRTYVAMTNNNEYEIVSLATVEADDTDEVEDETVYEQHPELRDLEMIDDSNELARILLESGLYPHAHPRIEALFRRAAAGKGESSRLLAASGMI